MKTLIIIISIVFMASMSFAQGNGWSSRAKQAEKDLNQIKVEVSIMYRMISEMYIAEKGIEKYRDLVFSEEDEVLNEK